MASKSKVLFLYRRLLKEGRQFDNYNYRNYAVRRIKDAFRENRNLSDAGQIDAWVKKGEENLEILKRQVTIGRMYQSPTVAIENLRVTPGKPPVQ